MLTETAVPSYTWPLCTKVFWMAQICRLQK